MKRFLGVCACTLLIASISGCTGTLTTTTSGADATVEANKALFARFMDEVVNQGRMETIDELLAADFVEHETGPGIPEGIEGVKTWFSMARAGFPDLHATIEHSVGEGDLVVIHSRWTGTHQGEFMGVPASGKTVDFAVMDMVRFADGKAVEHWGVSDMMMLMMQIGAIPEPTAS